LGGGKTNAVAIISQYWETAAVVLFNGRIKSKSGSLFAAHHGGCASSKPL